MLQKHQVISNKRDNPLLITGAILECIMFIIYLPYPLRTLRMWCEYSYFPMIKAQVSKWSNSLIPEFLSLIVTSSPEVRWLNSFLGLRKQLAKCLLCLTSSSLKCLHGSSLKVQWLKLHAANAGIWSLVRELGSCMKSESESRSFVSDSLWPHGVCKAFLIPVCSEWLFAFSSSHNSFLFFHYFYFYFAFILFLILE